MLEHEEFAQEGTIIRDILRAKHPANYPRSHAGANKSGHCQYGGVIRQHGKPLPFRPF